MPRPCRAVPALALCLAALGGCGDVGRASSLETEVKELRARAQDAEAERDKLADRLAQTERRLAGLHADFARLLETGGAKKAEAPAPAAGDVPAEPAAPTAEAQPPEGSEAGRELAAALDSEEGRAAFEKAMKAYEARREDQRRRDMAAEMVNRFAQRASLSPEQREAMLRIVSKTLTETSELWTPLRDADLPPEERSARRQEALAKMQEIGARTDEEVRGILDATQWDTYQQERSRMRGFLGGGGGPGGFGGGRGGDGGR